METINDLNNIDTIALNYNREGGFDWSQLPREIKAKILKINKDPYDKALQEHYKAIYDRNARCLMRAGELFDEVYYMPGDPRRESFITFLKHKTQCNKLYINENGWLYPVPRYQLLMVEFDYLSKISRMVSNSDDE